MNKKTLYTIMMALLCIPVITKGMLGHKHPKGCYTTKKDIPEFSHKSFSNISKLMQESPFQRAKLISSSSKKIETPEQELASGLSILAASPANVQKKIAEYLLPYKKKARDFYLSNPIKNVVLKYGQAEELIRKKSPFTEGLAPDHFLPLQTKELTMWRKLANHFKTKKSGPASITVTPSEYHSIQKLDSEMKRKFHNDDSFFTARVNQTPYQKALSIVTRILGYSALGTGLGTGVSYSLDCGEQILNSTKNVVIHSAKTTLSDTVFNPTYQKNMAGKSLQKASSSFHEGFSKKLFDIYSDPEQAIDFSGDTVEAIVRSTMSGTSNVIKDSSNEMYSLIKQDLSSKIPENCKQELIEKSVEIISNVPMPSLNNLKNGLSYGGSMGAFYGLISGLWENVIKNKPLFEEKISKI